MYESEVRAQIHRLGRLRGEGADFERHLTEGDAEITHRLKSDWGRLRTTRLPAKILRAIKTASAAGRMPLRVKGRSLRKERERRANSNICFSDI